jgi:hypothetical protein
MSLPWGDSPIDLPDETPGATNAPSRPGWSLAIVALSSLLLVAFNSHALKNWADQLPVNDATGRIADALGDWYARTDRLGLTSPVNGAQQAAERLRGAK